MVRNADRFDSAPLVSSRDLASSTFDVLDMEGISSVSRAAVHTPVHICGEKKLPFFNPLYCPHIFLYCC